MPVRPPAPCVSLDGKATGVARSGAYRAEAEPAGDQHGLQLLARTASVPELTLPVAPPAPSLTHRRQATGVMFPHADDVEAQPAGFGRRHVVDEAPAPWLSLKGQAARSELPVAQGSQRRHSSDGAGLRLDVRQAPARYAARVREPADAIASHAYGAQRRSDRDLGPNVVAGPGAEHGAGDGDGTRSAARAYGPEPEPAGDDVGGASVIPRAVAQLAGVVCAPAPSGALSGEPTGVSPSGTHLPKRRRAGDASGRGHEVGATIAKLADPVASPAPHRGGVRKSAAVFFAGSHSGKRSPA
jgi:hypothetical protein